MTDAEFQELLSACSEIATAFPEGVVFIGGMAVYLHAVNTTGTEELAGFTEEASLYISLRPLSKHQMVKSGFEFDIYTERLASLAVPYEAVLAYSQVFGEFRVSSLEHLLVLKLEAFRAQHDGAMRAEHAKDVLRIAVVAKHRPRGFRAGLVAPFFRGEYADVLDAIRDGPYAPALARGDAVRSKELHGLLDWLADALKSGLANPTQRRKRR
ncbi:MAG: hypothetical protein AMXMBFR72_11890 [Betaproteobacteria bacterium]